MLQETLSVLLIRVNSIPILHHRLGQQARKRHQDTPHQHQPSRNPHPHGPANPSPHERNENLEHLGRLYQPLRIGDVQARPDAHSERGAILAGRENAAIGVDGALGEAEDESGGDGGLVEGDVQGRDGLGCLEGQGCSPLVVDWVLSVASFSPGLNV